MMEDELRLKFVGQVTSFWKEAEDPEFEGAVVVEVVDWAPGAAELSFNMGKRHVYIALSREDFLRATADASATDGNATK